MTTFQKPNKFALIALFGLLIAFPTSDIIEDIAMIIGTISGIIWSYLEITTGVNQFRKTLGIVGIITIGIFLLFNLQ